MKYLISHINILEDKVIVSYNKSLLFYIQEQILNLKL